MHVIINRGVAGGFYVPGEPRADGQYLKAFDPDGADGFGSFEWTSDIRKALRFPDAGAAWETWRKQSTVRPTRDDGKPNRPLTMFTVEVAPLAELERKAAALDPIAEAVHDAADALAKDAAAKGMLIEAGWLALQAVWIPPNAPQHQIDDMRKAFMAGAQHLWASIYSIMDEDRDPTSADLHRMDLIDKELRQFGAELAADLGLPSSLMR